MGALISNTHASAIKGCVVFEALAQWRGLFYFSKGTRGPAKIEKLEFPSYTNVSLSPSWSLVDIWFVGVLNVA